MIQTDYFWLAMFLIAVLFGASAWASQQGAAAETDMLNDLTRQLQVGDVVFIRIPSAPFTKVSDTTSSWTNHVGIVSDVSGAEPLIAESRVPLSGETTWSRFVKRSETGRVAVARLDAPLNEKQQDKLKQAIKARRGILYDTGFDLHSSRQFCSRFVREVLDDATGVNSARCRISPPCCNGIHKPTRPSGECGILATFHGSARR